MLLSCKRCWELVYISTGAVLHHFRCLHLPAPSYMPAYIRTYMGAVVVLKNTLPCWLEEDDALTAVFRDAAKRVLL